MIKFPTFARQRGQPFLEALFMKNAFFNYCSEIMLISFSKSNWKYSKGPPVARKMAGFRDASLKPQVQQTYMYLLKMSTAGEFS